MKLWNYIEKFNPTILTTPARSMKHCKDDKAKWVAKYLGKDIEVKFSSEKEKYAHPKAILIDDMDYNIIPWKEAGGISIKHISANNSISELREVLNKEYKGPKKVTKSDD